jgi:hypothetical protein
MKGKHRFCVRMSQWVYTHVLVYGGLGRFQFWGPPPKAPTHTPQSSAPTHFRLNLTEQLDNINTIEAI